MPNSPATIGAELHERTDTRSNHRNGGRNRTLSTPAGDIELRIPKLRAQVPQFAEYEKNAAPREIPVFRITKN